MSIRYHLGNLLKRFGYKVARDYRWPEIHGNLLVLGFALLSAQKPAGRIQVLQIGAFDGQMCDPLKEILSCEMVDAVLVEPQAEPYQSLVSRYAGNPRIRIINAAVGEFDGEATLYVPSSEASAKASLIAGHHSRFGTKAQELRKVTVPSISVHTLVQSQLQHPDVLQLDTEGMDYRILRWFLLAGIEPSVVNFETLHLDKQERLASRVLLQQKGYWWIDTNQDTFAIKESLVRLSQQ